MHQFRVTLVVVLMFLLGIAVPASAQDTSNPTPVPPPGHRFYTTPDDEVESSLALRCGDLGVIIKWTQPVATVTEKACDTPDGDKLKLTADCGGTPITITAKEAENGYHGYLAFVEFYGPCPASAEDLKTFGSSGSGACNGDAATFEWEAEVLRYIGCWNAAPMP